MKIGIDCRMWDETGIGRYIRNIVTELALLDTENQYVLFVLSKDKDKINLGPNFELRIADIRWHTFKEQLILPFYFYAAGLDILFIPNLNVPVLYLKKHFVTIHDLTVLKVKTGRASTHFYLFYLLKRLGVRIALFFAIHTSKKLFTVTDFVKNEILDSYNIPNEKVLVTPCAVDPKFERKPENAAILDKYGISKPYIFYVGNAHPHKNLERLLQAFELIHKQNSDLELVLGGNKYFFYERLEREWSQSPIFNKIKFIGYVDDVDLPSLYSMAEALVNPSLYEGFGIQLLEAFACGTKVACSSATSLPEIGGNIAYYFNPKDINNMANTILACLADTDHTRIAAGFERIKEFSWKSSAQVIYSAFIGS